MSIDTQKQNKNYINTSDDNAFFEFSSALYSAIGDSIGQYGRDIIFVCIGTDRSTGDSLGPLVGYKIREMRYKNIYVFGDLENPVHAKNLPQITNEIVSNHNNPFIIAIDACLGTMEHVGYITVGKGAIKPGSGVNKDLEPIGDIHITGIVNFGGFMDFLILQNTRLSLVMKIADIVANGIKYVSWRISKENDVKSIMEI
jgi:putative sporulation protein YyaC